ncbi:Uncharacterized membrane protein [Cnuella takakiae]|uniref:Uncharacterized membrane protein n=1 Tax=Cnuella takakiae TaxID=1302690 RepID=A0A1M4XYD0_9BACT|nr:chitobiase/beta-hexosaminidase C-terminal domain-containing protein [Cnuella takakiae]OLY92986.1 hypothetical protein BUE76_14605 [Cnuella takakiae]SHE98445.1 Uncharacterized membrane protein [Cnuella takakiae]
MKRTHTFFYNACFALNCLLLFLILFESRIVLPTLLQVVGRMHPMMLHFPVVMVIVSLLWELFAASKNWDSKELVGDIFLLASAVTSVFTALAGLFLSREAGYDAGLLAGHKWGGLALSLLTLFLFTCRHWLRNQSHALKVFGFAGFFLLLFTAHQGANLTHGAGFLSEPLVAAATPEPVLLEDAQVFPHLVQPILETRCVQCHNEKKKKGDLLMTSYAALLQGGKSGALWDSLAADGGLLLKRIHLPLTEKKHMPPQGRPQLTEEEMAILVQWIRKGAPNEQQVITLQENDTLRQLAAAQFKTAESEEYHFDAADAEIIAKLNTNYCLVQPIAEGSAALSVSFFSPSQFKPSMLKGLLAIKEQMVSLNLNGIPVTDAELDVVGQMKALRKLNLGFTKVTGTGLSQLKDLKELRQLTLSGTSASGAVAALLPHLPKLKKVALWQTKMEPAQLARFATEFPKLYIEKGYSGDSVTIRLNPPVVDNKETVIRDAVDLNLRHVVKGAEIRYTLDGSDPDSLLSPVFTGNVKVDRSMVVKAKAFKPGWISSAVVEKHFFRAGIKPDSIRLLTPPDPQYKAVGGAALADAKKGDLNFRSGLWLGYKDKPMMAIIFLSKPQKVSAISLSTLVDVNSYIMPAYKVTAWGGKKAGALKLLTSFKPKQPGQGSGGTLAGIDLPFEPQEMAILKLVVEPVPVLPGWHPGKGQRGWFFVDEVFIN